MGNHDLALLNSQDFTKPYSEPMAQYIADLWGGEGNIIYEEQAIESFKKWGYYQQRLKFHPKARLIAVNSESCYTFNMYLSKTRDDPGGQLEWLENLLAEMEANDEIAIIAAHIPPSAQDCAREWSIRYRAIMVRYQHIVRLQIHGHTHLENIQLVRSFSDSDDSNLASKAVGVHHTTGSGTSYAAINPSFRLFELDS
jgi:sphingomyelin phosphodiesterase